MSEGDLALITQSLDAAFPGRSEALLDEVERWLAQPDPGVLSGEACLFCRARPGEWWLIQRGPPRGLCHPCVEALARRVSSQPPFPGEESMLADCARALRAQPGGPEGDRLLAAVEAGRSRYPLMEQRAECAGCGLTGRERWCGPAGPGLCPECRERILQRVPGNTDPRRDLLRRLDREIRRARRRGRVVSVAVGEVDREHPGFPAALDQTGTVFEPLVAIAKEVSGWQPSVIWVDSPVLGRTSRRRIVLVGAGVPTTEMAGVAERIRTLFEERRLYPLGDTRWVTVSLGVGEASGPAPLAAAEQALAEAKRAGGNRVTGLVA